MVVVITILGWASAFPAMHGPPRSGGAVRTATVTDIVQNLRLARSRAIAEGAPSAILIDAARHLLLLDGVAQRPLPPGLALSLESEDGRPARLIAFRFAPDGSAQGGLILLGQPPHRIEIAVNWLTGAVETRDAR